MRTAFQFRSAQGNADGCCWSVQTAARYQWDSTVTPAARCHVCMLGMLREVQGNPPDDAWVFRELVPSAKWSWQGGKAGSAADFTASRMKYERFNQRLHELLVRANFRRADLGLSPWKLAEFHWHMFRHGSAIMALLFKTPESEIMRSLRMTHETLRSYRAHVLTEYGMLFDRAQQQAGVEQRAWTVDCDRIAAQTVGAGTSTCGRLRDELLTLCRLLGIAPNTLRRAPAGFRQLVIHGAASNRMVSTEYARPLLEEMRRADATSAHADAEATGVLVSPLITAADIVLPLQQPSALLEAIVDYEDDEDTIRGDGETDSQADTQAGDLQDLKDKWNVLNAVARSGL